MEGCPADRLMRTRGAVLPGAKGGVPNLIRGATQARRRAGIDIGVSDPAPRGAAAITERVEICVSNGLPRPAPPFGVKEGGVADVGAGTGLGYDDTGNEQEEEK